MQIKNLDISALEALLKSEKEKFSNDINELWDNIKIEPELWKLNDLTKELKSFWVVAIINNEIIWFNEIEKGFNISEFKEYGTIETYYNDEFTLENLLWHIS